jgi:hypothetical protein
MQETKMILRMELNHKSYEITTSEVQRNEVEERYVWSYKCPYFDPMRYEEVTLIEK